MISETIHTSGDWFLSDQGDPKNLPLLLCARAEDGGEVHIAAVLMLRDFPDVPEHDRAEVEAECLANASLIAAAPGMQSALRELLLYVRQAGVPLYAIRQAETALAESIGETP